jgi:hypothetical protein
MLKSCKDMNKSTPIAQLPIQNTVHTMGQPPMPPQMSNTNTSHIPLDDDATIQEVLNKLNAEPAASAGGTSSTEHYSEQDYNSLMMQATQPQELQDYSEAVQHHQMYLPDDYGNPNYKNKLMNEILSFNDSIKISLVAGLIFVAIYLSPVEKIVFKYISALENVPYSHVLVKSLCIVVLMFVAQKLL